VLNVLDVRAVFKGRIHHNAVELAQIAVLLQKIAWMNSVPSKRVMEGQPVGQSRVDLDRFNVGVASGNGQNSTISPWYRAEFSQTIIFEKAY
jgi:hypothetical protein